ncbi:glyoxalase/bleomycin resistance protein/dioxygenase [Leptospira ryugenii]|uniref:Glyoxalase/bleomycin resistance protein/dioxygenase n=1 Tax=Leptospira ryugenii TaxID=1917863 RepID=A0A2P2DXE8_9LEPT|nr:VOC family protein [Leptospira ryugenii]GBF49314.1 glyoxalase/bleomycin resistance protein/dioxygenase [Leptospira ryugenii]
MAQINPHINFNGNAEEAFRFYQSVFGGKLNQIVRLKDLAGPDFPIPDIDADKIMHISLPIGNSLLIGNDVPSFLGKVDEKENRSKISVSTDSKEEADTIFLRLAKTGTVEAEIGDSPWGTYFGMLRDQFGIEWIIEFNAKKT